LRPDQVARIDSALLKGYDFSAGDVVTIVDGENRYDVTCINYDLEAIEGLEVASMGLANDGAREVVFTKRDITAGPGSLLPTMWFEINGERWDFRESAKIQDAVVPLGGLQNLIVVQLTKAAELNKTNAQASWEWSS